jgi:transglutaminase-like putative cysteine protease
VAVAIAAAVPFTARLGDEAALVRYSAWSWAAGPGTAFEWEHSYGPIDWDRSEDTVMLVESDQPNYWKASVLDRFDGRTWERSGLVRPSVELPTDVEADVVPSELEAEWFTEVSVSISGLRSDLAVGPGSSRSVVSGIDARPSSDGSLVRTLVEPLSKGDVYKTRGYAPDPTAEQMRGAGWSVPRELALMTEIDLPQAAGGPNDRVRTLGLSEGRAEDARRAIAASPYGRMAQLADRLTAGAPSAYDAVKAIEAHLLANYSYSETPPDRPLPLESFLFEDRVGYCQQFSGAMAVMLRMVGIPARVATGFSPGIHEGGDRFRVRVLDAHSWVEVYFAGIGWVPFDPTPAVAPAELRTGGTSAASSAASSLGPLLYGARGFFGDGDDGGPGPRGGGGGPLPTPPPPESSPSAVSGLWLIVAMLVAAAAAVGPGVWRRLRERGATRDELVEARVRELERALRRLRFRHQPDTTLLDVERSLRSRAEPLAARYVQRLRRLRYGREPLDGLPPGGERRALRRRLRVRGGLTARLASYRAIPPLSPRR